MNCTSERGKSRPNQVHRVSHLLHRLRRLRDHSNPWMLVERQDIVLAQHHVEAIEIAGETAHLDVVALSHDDEVIAVARQRGDGAVRHLDERAGRLDDGQAERSRPRQSPPGRAVGRHHQRRGRDVGDVLRDRNAFGFECAEDGGVVDEIAEDREGARVGVLERERDGVAHAEAHAEACGSKDAHDEGSLHRVLCNVKLLYEQRISPPRPRGRVLRHGSRSRRRVRRPIWPPSS